METMIIPSFISLSRSPSVSQNQIYGIGRMAIKTPEWEAISDGKFLSDVLQMHDVIPDREMATPRRVWENITGMIGNFIFGLWHKFDEKTRVECLDRYLQFVTEIQLDEVEAVNQFRLLREMTVQYGLSLVSQFQNSPNT
eukprot:TRINITY_DN9489_c0_g1_i1.p1 TRINITY_DN9489_c0_g1~~TRINITY_DN9489_c0_g1_i1.p1  ORF type:complete len:140 (+),score=19.28 TRINITY_DN9489_c0_g1_i1:50-469(+)